MIIKEITSRQNPLIKRLYELAHKNNASVKSGSAWLEGEHLCQAYLEKIGAPEVVICSKTGYETGIYSHLIELTNMLYIVDDILIKQVSVLESPGQVGYLIPLTHCDNINPNAASVVLDRLQDPGNVGSILRSAAAFGFKQIIALKGTSALFSSKVLRAGMGAHFSLNLFEQIMPEDLQQLKVPIISTSSHTEKILQNSEIPFPCAWIFGHEGQGVQPELMEKSHLTLRIDQPGGEESLNAAMAASICLYETVRQSERKMR